MIHVLEEVKARSVGGSTSLTCKEMRCACGEDFAFRSAGRCLGWRAGEHGSGFATEVHL